jgi:hypothetical protein
MATRQSLQNFGQAFSRGIEPILAALIAKRQEDEFNAALEQSRKALVNPSAGAANPSNYVLTPENQPAAQPDIMAVLANILSGNPGIVKNPNFAPAFNAAAAIQPKFQMVPQGSMVGRVDPTGRFTPEGINPKPLPQEKPAAEPNLQGTKYVDQNNTEWRIFFNPKTGEETRRVKVGPAAQSTLQSGKNSQYAAMVDLLNNIKAGKKDDYLGGALSGGGGLLGGVREITGMIDDQEAQFRANVSSLANQLLYLRSGAQINEQEFERLMKEMPSVTLAPNVFESRLQAFEKQLSSMLRAKNIDPASVGLSAQAQQKTQPVDDPLGIF